MFNFSKTCKRLVLTDLALSLIACGAFSILLVLFKAFFQINIFNFIVGMFFGTAFTVLKILLLDRTLNKAVDMPEEKAVNYTRLHYTLRYFLTGVVIVVGALNPRVSLLGVVVAMVLLRPSAYLTSKQEKKENNESALKEN